MKGFYISIMLSISIMLGFLGAECEARVSYISIHAEKVYARQYVDEIKTDDSIKSIQSNDDLLRIQKEIVEANSSELWFQNQENAKNPDFFLRPVFQINYKNGKEEASNLLDGYIVISNGMLDFANLTDSKNKKRLRENKKENVYNNSQIAFILAHESAHWANNEPKITSNNISRMVENKADRKGLSFLTNTLLYGYGGGLIDFHRRVLAGKEGGEKHDPSSLRFINVTSMIFDASEGKVKVSKEGDCIIHKRKFLAPARLDGEASSIERTFYVTGQIASAMELGLWKETYLKLATEDEIFQNGSSKIVLLLDNGSGTRKVIDRIDLMMEEYQKIEQASWWETFFGFVDEPEEYAYLKNLMDEVKII